MTHSSSDKPSLIVLSIIFGYLFYFKRPRALKRSTRKDFVIIVDKTIKAVLSDDASVIFYQSDYIGPSVRSNPLYLVGLYGSGSSLQALKEVRSPKHKRVRCA